MDSRAGRWASDTGPSTVPRLLDQDRKFIQMPLSFGENEAAPVVLSLLLPLLFLQLGHQMAQKSNSAAIVTRDNQKTRNLLPRQISFNDSH